MRVHGNLKPGETANIVSNQGEFLAKASYNPRSQIAARIWTWNQDDEINPDFFEKRIKCAIAARRMFDRGRREDEAERLVHAESDGLPGFIVDRYADVLVVQFLSVGAEYWREILVDQLEKISGIGKIFERSDVDARRLEGLDEKAGPVRGKAFIENIQIVENGLRFSVDIRKGHKTGFYLDQSVNRQRVRELSRGKEVLDCFCYTGGFSLNAIVGGAKSIISVDSSADALLKASENLNLNKNLPAERITFLEGDVFQVLRGLRDKNAKYDMIILDPPKFAPTVSQVAKATRGYKDINLLGFKLLRTGGLLVTFSCSGGVSEDLFQKIVAGAALDAGVNAQILERLSQSPDHLVALNFPEGAYLKGFVIRVI